MKDLQHSNAQIYIYTKYASMDINILDIIYIVQFKIPDFITLQKLLQRLSWIEKNKSRVAIAIFFVHLSQVLLNNVHMLEHSAFKSLQLPVNRENCQ